MKYSEKKAPSSYLCKKCNATGIRLWRLAHTFLNEQVLLCARCACQEEEKEFDFNEQGRRMSEYGVTTDQIGHYVPAVPTEEEDTFWGYTSVPPEGVQWWYGLPWLSEAKQ